MVRIRWLLSGEQREGAGAGVRGSLRRGERCWGRREQRLEISILLLDVTSNHSLSKAGSKCLLLTYYVQDFKSTVGPWPWRIQTGKGESYAESYIAAGIKITVHSSEASQGLITCARLPVRSKPGTGPAIGSLTGGTPDGHLGGAGFSPSAPPSPLLTSHCPPSPPRLLA